MSKRLHDEEHEQHTVSDADADSFYSAQSVILSELVDDEFDRDEQLREQSKLKRRKIDRTEAMQAKPRHPHQLDGSQVVVPRRQSSLASTRPCRRTDLMALHKKSCRLFSSIDGTLLHSHSTPLLSEHQPSFITSTRSSSVSVDVKAPSTTKSSMSLLEPLIESSEPKPCRPPLATVMSWTSDQSRKAEYEKIDRAHGGVRGVWKRLMPKICQSKHTRRGFFQGTCDGQSVRRLRLDLPQACSEKHTQRRWGCFGRS